MVQSSRRPQRARHAVRPPATTPPPFSTILFPFSLAPSRYACIRAIAQHKVTFRIASSSLARFVIARVARSRHARLPPAVSLLSHAFARKNATAKYFALRTQTRASVALGAAVARAGLRAVWVKQVIAARVVGDGIKAVVPRRSFRCVCVSVLLSCQSMSHTLFQKRCYRNPSPSRHPLLPSLTRALARARAAGCGCCSVRGQSEAIGGKQVGEGCW